MQQRGNTNKSPNYLNATENKFDTGDCLRMGKTTEVKPYRVILRSPLPRIYYYQLLAVTSISKSYQTLWPIPKYQLSVEFLPQYPIGLVL